MFLSFSFIAVQADTWSYYIKDSFEDSTFNGSRTPGSIFEMYGMAMRQSGNTVYFAFNVNMPIAGTTANSAHIGWGDFILNFGDLNTYNPNGPGLYAVHFAGNNSDSGVTQNGVYGSVTTQSLSTTHQGWASLQSYLNTVGSYASLGGISYNSGYFNLNAPAQTSIQTGNLLSSINLLNATDLSTLGLNFASGLSTPSQSLGSETFGFSFALQAGMTGNFVAHLTMECSNDMMVMTGTVPEPQSMALLALSMLIGYFLKSMQKSK